MISEPHDPRRTRTRGRVRACEQIRFSGPEAAAIDLEATFAHLQTEAPAAIWLDSAATAPASPMGQRSVLAIYHPGLTADRDSAQQLVRWDRAAGQLQISDAQGQVQSRPCHSAAELIDYLQTSGGDWFGYLSCESGLDIGTGPGVRPYGPSQPDGYWLRPAAFILVDHLARTITLNLAAGEDPALLDWLERQLALHPVAPRARTHKTGATDGGRWGLTDTQYLAAIETIKSRIQTGDIAEACLTDTWTLHLDPDPDADPDPTPATDHPGRPDHFELYRRLRHANPAPYAAYARFSSLGDDLEIFCASPERFLTLTADGQVETKPIKGTAARHSDPATDRQIADRLGADPKTRSEILPVIDELTTQLARVAAPGTVTVPIIAGVETFATVHQLVSTIRAQLDTTRGQSLADLLDAVFPGASMIGAPAGPVIDLLTELEAAPRGIYSGAIGWLGADGSAELNVVIRTLIRTGNRFSIGAGGGVVADSDPQAELAERNLKAATVQKVLIDYLDRP